MGQSRSEAVQEARQFVYENSIGTLNTVNQQGSFKNMPAGQPEYYADTAASDASLLMIAVDMSTPFKNIARGSPASLSIRKGDAPGQVTPHDVAANPRIVIFGELDYSQEASEAEMEQFFKLHPDARAWCPGQPGFHATKWVRFIPTGIRYVGGFGDEHFIGTLPLAEYVEAKPETNVKAKGILSTVFGM